MGLVRRSDVKGKIAKKLLYPQNLFHVAKLLCTKSKHQRVNDDSQLKLYSKMLPNEFLHYGYFDDPQVQANELSFKDVEDAQLRYAEKILEQVMDKENPILDAGCGMGGLSREIKSRGWTPVAVTPDNSQASYIGEKYPNLELHHARYEDYPTEAQKNRFGTIIHSESLQYMNLDEALAINDILLKPKGRWIVTDYFRKQSAFEKSGHMWEEFKKRIEKSPFKIVHHEDITANVLPTMMFSHLLAQRLGVPLVEFIFDKIETKNTALHFILEEVIDDMRIKLKDQLKVIHPDIFARDKSYVLLVLERK